MNFMNRVPIKKDRVSINNRVPIKNRAPIEYFAKFLDYLKVPYVIQEYPDYCEVILKVTDTPFEVRLTGEEDDGFFYREERLMIFGIDGKSYYSTYPNTELRIMEAYAEYLVAANRLASTSVESEADGQFSEIFKLLGR